MKMPREKKRGDTKNKKGSSKSVNVMEEDSPGQK